ncbi:unnamed protein product [Gordionus sp. m RMFG-2023]|uniref:islet cell autoantigen 1-like protein n=1 Tax=Gordionus sp. m RMFG-2023 TaxID=3053472 RepID=UPI0030E3CF25
MNEFGYSGPNFDRHVEHQDNTTIGKVKERYWIAKQTFRKKLGKKEDDCVIACDAELDAKLEIFNSIATSCIDLLLVIEDFQENVAELAEQENHLGKFVQDKAKQDKTKAATMLSLFGKSQLLSAYHRIQLQNPLQRMYDDICVFHDRAVKDTFQTIENMEKARLNYRAALLWMKDISQNLDPDTFKQLENFRKVQNQVKRTKARFEKLKVDCMQKIDLLTASRCNLFSNVLSGYQKFLVRYWGSMSKVLRKVLKSFDGYQYYEFSKLKQLTEISKKLAQEMAPTEPGTYGGNSGKMGEVDLSTVFSETYEDSDPETCGEEYKSSNQSRQINRNDQFIEVATDAVSSLGEPFISNEDEINTSYDNDFIDRLLSLDLDGGNDEPMVPCDSRPAFENKTVNMTLKQGDPDTNINLLEASSSSSSIFRDSCSKDTRIDDDSNLAKYLSLGDRFSGADLSCFGDFMPSSLLDDRFSNSVSTSTQLSPTPYLPPQKKSNAILGENPLDSAQNPSNKNLKPTNRNDTLPPANKKILSNGSWLEKFADLDPLANPDLIGYLGKEEDNAYRNC